MATKAQAKADEIRSQMEALSQQLAEIEEQAKAEELALIKEIQKRRRFTARELGTYFKPRRRGGLSE